MAGTARPLTTPDESTTMIVWRLSMMYVACFTAVLLALAWSDVQDMALACILSVAIVSSLFGIGGWVYLFTHNTEVACDE